VTITDSNSCTITKSYTITEPTQLQATGITKNVSCNGGTNGTITQTVSGGTANNGNYSYLWHDNNTTKDRTGLQAGSYSVTITDSNSCTITKSYTITEPTQLQATGITKNVSCNGGTNGTITQTVSGGTANNGNYSYLWSDNNTTKDRTGLQAGSYSVTITDSNSCTITKSYTITEPTQLQATGITKNVSCNGGTNGTITQTVSGGTANNGNYSYLWSDNNTTKDRTGLQAGSYSVTITDSNSCTLVKVYQVSQPDSILIRDSIKVVDCYGQSNGAINLGVSGGTGVYQFSWSTGAFTKNLSGLLSGQYTVTVVDSNLCQKVVTYTVLQPDSLSITELVSNVKCFAESNGSITLNVSGGNAPFAYTWTNNVSNTNTALNLVAGTYAVDVRDTKGCSLSNTFVITEPTILANTLTKKDLRCNKLPEGEIYTQVTGGTTPYTYNWLVGSASGSNPTTLFAGNYVLEVTDQHGCKVFDTIMLLEPSAIGIQTNVVDVSCFGDSTGSVQALIAGGILPYTLQWSNGATTPMISNLSVGNYTLTVVDKNSCSATISKTVNQPTLLALSVSIKKVSCDNRSDAAFYVAPSGGVAPYKIEWSRGLITDTIKNLSTGEYDITVTDKNNCTKVQRIVIDSVPPIQLTGIAKNITCQPLTDAAIDLSIVGGTPLYNIKWSNKAITEDVANLSVGNYSVTVSDANGCTDTAYFSIKNDSLFAIQTIGAQVIELGDKISLNTTHNGVSTVSFDWKPINEYTGIDCNTCQSPEVAPTVTTQFKVKAIDARGCINYDSVTIFIVPNRGIYIPNAFTPNNDGNNDNYKFFGKKSAIGRIEIQIFNRWGEKVFESTDKEFEWDGTYKGEPQSPGIYIYQMRVVYLDSHEENLNGSISLIR
jgi:gliding motility-associated-like protein